MWTVKRWRRWCSTACAALQVAAVKAPGFGDRRKAMLQDIATLTGGQVVSEDLGMKFENVGMNELGTAKKVVMTKDDTTVVDGAGEQAAIEARTGQIRNQIDETKSDYDREKLQERLRGSSTWWRRRHQRGRSDRGRDEREAKDRVEDALAATRAAVEEGIVAGGGVALLRASKALDSVSLSADQQVGVSVVQRALQAPLRQIAANAGADASVVVNKVLESADTTSVTTLRRTSTPTCSVPALSTRPRSVAARCSSPPRSQVSC